MAIYDLPLAAIGVGISLMNVLALKFIGERRQDLSRSLAIEQRQARRRHGQRRATIETLKASGLEDEAFGRWAGIQAKALNAEQALGVPRSSRNAADAVLRTDRRRDPWHRRLARDRGLAHAGKPGGFQSLMASFSAPGHRTGQLRRKLSDHQGRARTPGGRLQLSARQFRQGRPPGGSLSPEAGRQGRAGQHPVRLLDPGAAIAGRPFHDCPAGCEDCAGRRLRQRKINARQLICGLYRPWAGEIRIDGWPFPEIPSQVFANSVAYVDQDVFLFEGTRATI